MRSLGLGLVVACMVAGCAETPAPHGEVNDAGTPGVTEGDAAATADAGCAEGEQQECVCSQDTFGTRTCSVGVFGACQACIQVSPDLPKCVAGKYSGNFRGRYRSEPGGLCGLTAGDEGPLDLDVTFELIRDDNDEFYEIRGGCLRVPGQEKLDSPQDSAYGHSWMLSGSVDCSTGSVDFEWHGTYVAADTCQLGLGWARYFNQGAVSGTYNPVSQSFVDTHWDLHERPPLLGGPATGGTGTFTARLVEAGGTVDDVSERACLGVDFPSDLTPQPVPSPR
jgi:hypothetical protein